jgi:hypothetical protein
MANLKLLLVNRTKKQYLNPLAFGENNTFYHIIVEKESVLLKALGYLIATRDPFAGTLQGLCVHGYGHEMIGYWEGDDITLTNDADPSNLYRIALERYTDISSNVAKELLDMDGDLRYEPEFPAQARTAMFKYINMYVPVDQISVTGKIPLSAVTTKSTDFDTDPDDLEIV